MTTYSCVYLLIEREFIKTNEKIYKIGFSDKLNLHRFNQYPKESQLLVHIYTDNGRLCEKEILHTFKKIFKHRTDIGNEYFEGDYKKMRNIMFMIIEEIENIKEKINTDNTIDNDKYLEYIKKDKELREKERIEKYKIIEEKKNKLKSIKIEQLKKKEEKIQKKEEQLTKKEEKIKKKEAQEKEKIERDNEIKIIESNSVKEFLKVNCETTNNINDKISSLELFLKYKNSKYNKNIDIKKFAFEMTEINKIYKKKTHKGMIYVRIKYI